MPGQLRPRATTRNSADRDAAGRLERGLVAIRWFGVAFGLFQVWQTSLHPPAPPPYVVATSYALVALLATGNTALAVALRRLGSEHALSVLGMAAFALDAVTLFGFAWIYSFDPTSSTWVVIYILPLEAALRYRLGGAVLAIALAMLSELGREIYVHARYTDEPFFISSVTFRVGVFAIIALVAGMMARSLARRATVAERQAAEFERLAEQEHEAARKLQAIDEMKNSFLEAVSHELRTPLSSVLGFAVTLERPDLDLAPQTRRDMLQRLTANARKLERLLADLLDLDRLARGTVTARRQPIDLPAVVERIAEEAEMGGRPLQLDLPPLVAEVDGSKVERILENLLTNAARHTPEGTPVWVRLEERPGGLRLVVEDSGPGVPDHLKRSVFEPFQRGENPSHAPGTGVGLSLVMRFAELHGGTAWVEDRPGGGASVHVFLPTPEPVEDHSTTAITSPS